MLVTADPAGLLGGHRRPGRRAGRDRRRLQPVPARLGDLPAARPPGHRRAGGAACWPRPCRAALRAAELTNGAGRPDRRRGRAGAGLRPRLRRGSRRRRRRRRCAGGRRRAGGGWAGTPDSDRCSCRAGSGWTSARRRRRWPPTASPPGPPRPPGAACSSASAATWPSAGPPPEAGWPVGVADDHTDREPAVSVTLTEGGLATSGTARRRWRRAGRTVHHIVDPRTGDVAAPCWRTVTVVAATCVDANTASTAAVVMGPAAAAVAGGLRAARPAGRRGRRGHPRRGLARGGAGVTQALWFASRVLRAGRAAAADLVRRARRAAHRPGRHPVLAAVRAARPAPQPRPAHGRLPRASTWRRRSSTRTRASGGGTPWCRSCRPTTRSGRDWARPPRTCCVALVVTSLVRTRLPWRLWRGLHVAAYALWPVALVHGLGHRRRRQHARLGADRRRRCASWRWSAPSRSGRVARHPDTEARRIGGGACGDRDRARPAPRRRRARPACSRAGSTTGAPADHAEHVARYGPLPLEALAGRPGRAELIETVRPRRVARPGRRRVPDRPQTGRGRRRAAAAGSWWPTAAKGDPAASRTGCCSSSPRTSCSTGVVLAAAAVGAARAPCSASPRAGCRPPGSTARSPSGGADPVAVRVVEVPHRYVASEESALVRFLTRGDARPTDHAPAPGAARRARQADPGRQRRDARPPRADRPLRRRSGTGPAAPRRRPAPRWSRSAAPSGARASTRSSTGCRSAPCSTWRAARPHPPAPCSSGARWRVASAARGGRRPVHPGGPARRGRRRRRRGRARRPPAPGVWARRDRPCSALPRGASPRVSAGRACSGSPRSPPT